jgi:hypothetical protein
MFWPLPVVHRDNYLLREQPLERSESTILLPIFFALSAMGILMEYGLSPLTLMEQCSPVVATITPSVFGRVTLAFALGLCKAIQAG